MLALLVSHRAKLGASTITHPCVCGRWGRRVLAPTAICAVASVHRQPFVPLHRATALCGCLYASLHNGFVRPPSCILCTFMNALWALRPCNCGRWGRCIVQRLCATAIAHPCTTRKLRVLPPGTQNSTPLNERGAIFGADGGGRTRTVLLPTDFESVTSANSITSAYIVFVKAHYITIITISQFDYYIIAEKYCQ